MIRTHKEHQETNLPKAKLHPGSKGQPAQQCDSLQGTRRKFGPSGCRGGRTGISGRSSEPGEKKNQDFSAIIFSACRYVSSSVDELRAVH